MIDGRMRMPSYASKLLDNLGDGKRSQINSTVSVNVNVFKDHHCGTFSDVRSVTSPQSKIEVYEFHF